jgi:peroxiredoxin Q/BCP
MFTFRPVLLVLAASVLAVAPIPNAAATEPPSPNAPGVPAVGQRAPDFTLPSSSGGNVRLSRLKGRTVVLYFYPKDETPGCTHEACDFRDHHAALDSAGVLVLGVSNDDLESHRHFTAKEHLPFPLLADGDARVSRQYGVYRARERDGKTLMGIERTTFVIDKTGHIARVWPKVSVDGHVEDVLAFVRGG